MSPDGGACAIGVPLSLTQSRDADVSVKRVAGWAFSRSLLMRRVLRDFPITGEQTTCHRSPPRLFLCSCNSCIHVQRAGMTPSLVCPPPAYRV